VHVEAVHIYINMLTDSNGEGILFFVTGLSVQAWKETANVVGKKTHSHFQTKKLHV
jgi:hypothetical protein